MRQVVEMEFGGRKLSIESGEMAKQADGAVLVQYGETVVLVTAVAKKEARTDIDFFPLTIDYREKTYAAGKIPGGFFKREARPSDKETLTSRLIDRPVRPLFSDGFCNETQVICSVVSSDGENDADTLAIIGASAALSISEIPFLGPIGAVRVGRRDNEFVLNPTFKELESCNMNIVLAASKEGIIMVEGGAKELPEEILIDALLFGQDSINKILALQLDLQNKIGKTKISVSAPEVNEELQKAVADCAKEQLASAFTISNKQDRNTKLSEIRDSILEQLLEGVDDSEKDSREKEIKSIVSSLKKNIVRTQVTENGSRIDGRGLRDIRPITSRVGVLPRVHGSSLFTRGETQALVSITLGTSIDEQTIDSLNGKSSKSFMLHYNFPPFCVGETGFMRGPGRREIGHGTLAERAISAVIPSKEDFPYTIRSVSEILESNGSSSMASVCGTSLSLMDAGVPISTPVAGIAMGLIKEGEKIAILSDILGDEDHLGDMDFKVTGTDNGITALQMDIKISGIDKTVLENALAQAKEGRLHILGKMNETISNSRKDISDYAPRIITMEVKQSKIKDVIGPGGKTIRGIIEKTGVNVDINDSGIVSISSVDEASAQEAVKIIKSITQDAEIGKIYDGKVKRIMDFGAFVEIFTGTEGLVHISQIANRRVEKVADELSEGQEIKVKVLDIDKKGIKLSIKAALADGS